MPYQTETSAQCIGLRHGGLPVGRGEWPDYPGENLAVLRTLASESAELIYIDPPFNTGRRQTRPQMKTIRDQAGDRVGFGGRRYRTERLAGRPAGYVDAYDDYVGFLRPRMVEARRILTATGSLLLHVDPRESHYCKVMLDEVFERACFQNEIIWAYDYGARSTKRWPAKHDTIFWYTRDPRRYTFELGETDRIPYMAPSLVGEAKASRGKTPTDVWWHTIVSPTGKEKTGYPTQKPAGSSGADRAGTLAAGGAGAGLLCRERDDR